MKKYLPLFAALLVAIGSYSQVPVPKKCYMHLQGGSGKEVSVEADLVKINDTIFGEITIFGAFTSNKGVVTVGGHATGSNIFLSDADNENALKFRGKFGSGQTISGNFENTPGISKNIPVTLKELYLDGAIPMVVYFQEAKTPLVNQKGSPTAHTSMALLYPAETASLLKSDTLKKLILSDFSGSNVRNPNPDQTLNQLRQNYFENYISANESIYKPGMGQSFSWELLKYNHIVMNTEGLLTYYVEDYAFTGGAHGMQNREYSVFSADNGRLIGLRDIFKQGYENFLSDILTSRAQKENNLETGRSLKEAGFFVDEIDPTSNFYITRSGIGFFYNHYEIAPYSFGPQDYFIPFSELKNIIDKNGILKGLLM